MQLFKQNETDKMSVREVLNSVILTAIRNQPTTKELPKPSQNNVGTIKEHTTAMKPSPGARISPQCHIAPYLPRGYVSHPGNMFQIPLKISKETDLRCQH